MYMLLHLLCMAVQPNTFVHVQHLFLYSITSFFFGFRHVCPCLPSCRQGRVAADYSRHMYIRHIWDSYFTYSRNLQLL